MSEVIGTYRHQVNFLEPIEARSAFGDEQITWDQKSASWCRVDFQEAKSDEDEIASRVQAYTFAKISLRFRSDVTEKWRILFNSETYGIDAILPDSHQRHMVIKATKIEE